MPVFSEQIQALCDAVFSSKVVRAADVTELKAGAQEFLQEVRDTQRETFAEQKANLVANCQTRSEDVATFRDGVRREQRAAADQMQQKLDQNQQDRKQAVETMLKGFDQVQQAFAEQCQAATRIWREMKERKVGNS
ncbi:MAG: hypothetical protein NTY19_15955 [Planctomycetota bacterium]|nr:hypothetical protein [Planctomycetota bacterium]